MTLLEHILSNVKFRIGKDITLHHRLTLHSISLHGKLQTINCEVMQCYQTFRTMKNEYGNINFEHLSSVH